MVQVSDAEMYTHAHVVCLEERRGAGLVKAFLEIVAELQHRRGARGEPCNVVPSKHSTSSIHRNVLPCTR